MILSSVIRREIALIDNSHSSGFPHHFTVTRMFHIMIKLSCLIAMLFWLSSFDVRFLKLLFVGKRILRY